jgi:peptidoglycan/LPS O-acetylase OafA/YrhL
MELERTGKTRVGAFYVRRVTRIWPVYYFFLALSLIIGHFASVWSVTPPVALAWILMVGNWSLVLHGFGSPLGILWSVNIEEQFYLVCPWIVSWFRRRGLIMFSLASIGISVAALLWLGSKHIYGDETIRFNTLAEIQYFAAGAMLAVFIRSFGWPLRLVLFSCGVACWVGGTYFFDSRMPSPHLAWWTPATEYAIVAVGCVAIFLSFYGANVSRAARPLVYLGKISYGLYVYHMLFVVGMREVFPGRGGLTLRIGKALLSLGLTIGFASASYQWLETPFLRLKERFTFVKSRAA